MRTLVYIYIATSNRDACGGLPGNSLKIPLEIPYIIILHMTISG